MSRLALPLLIAATLLACQQVAPHSTCPPDGYPATAALATGCTPGPGWLAYAFIKEGTSNPALFISRADGSCARRVTTDAAFYGGPAFFPGGQRLAYASTRDGSNRLYLLDLESGLESPLETAYPFNAPPAPPTPLDAATPSVSPDGATIAFEGSLSSAAGSSDVFSVPSAGGNVLRITTDPSAATLPRWSPDGARLYFLSYRTGTQELFRAQADGSGVAQITSGSLLSSKYDVTPDGTALVYARFAATGTGSLPTELVSQDLATGAVRVIASGNEADPAVDPSGSSVAVSRRTPSGYDLYLLDYQSGAVKARLTGCPGQAFGAAFAR